MKLFDFSRKILIYVNFIKLFYKAVTHHVQNQCYSKNQKQSISF